MTHHLHQLESGGAVALDEIPTRGEEYCADRDQAEADFKKLRKELCDWQSRLYAAEDQRLLVVLQALDAGGKDGTIRRVFQGVNPQGVRVTSFKAPTRRELKHDYLWRVHQAVPAAGMIGVFNRSHYEDVLAVRVHEIVPEAVWRPRYEQINQFESLLNETGTKIVKIFLHISKQEQKERFEERLQIPEKNWKFSHEDLEKRKYWDDYKNAFQEMLERCTTDYAPWHVIPADQKWYRNMAVAHLLVTTLREMDPQYPSAPSGLDDIVVD
ncbi:MAG: polyphosphate kinase 2 family protein [Pirellulales bacterium]|nr:polyphosphate kinase 2 family protein [Pirellulales bacterium]